MQEPLIEKTLEPDLDPFIEPLEMRENPQHKETTMKEYAIPVIGLATALIQLVEAVRN